MNKDIYNLYVTEEDWIYTIRQEVVEKEWLNFLMDFYGMRYKGGYDEQYADEILKILSERSDFEG